MKSKPKTSMKILLMSVLLISTMLAEAQTKPPSHEIYDRLLKKNVTADGKVNYKAFIKDSVELNGYLKLLSSNPPDAKTWTKYEQMAYWINAYNAFTIKLITKYYPVKSIKDIGSKVQIPFVNTPWDIKFIKIGKEKMDLNNIEHGELRRPFDDARVHMALVCASKSCPILLNEAYDAKKLDEQLAKQAKAFLADPFRNKMSADKPQLSMIFKWYGMDFNKGDGTVRKFINTYSDIKIKPEAKISHIDYDWGLNEQ
jgi:Protein of unknown function, DUF547